MRKLLLAAAIIAISATSASAADPCIRRNQIRNWGSINDRTIVVEDFSRQRVQLRLIGTCSGLRFTDSLWVRSRAGGGSGLSCIQRGDTITTRNSGTRGTCSISSITPFAGPLPSRRGSRQTNATGATP
jgi:hypothetical protein